MGIGDVSIMYSVSTRLYICLYRVSNIYQIEDIYVSIYKTI